MSVDQRPLVTVVVPCRNEARFIGQCLESVMAGDYPHDRLEVLVVDGRSTDGTRDVLAELARRWPNLQMIDNPRLIIPAAMNIGIRAARGEIVIKIDAHAEYAADYVSVCAHRLVESGADNVGGVLEMRPADPGLMGDAIAAVLAHPFGSGNSGFRIGTSEPRWADTNAFGCFRRETFDRIGFYDERLVRSSDMDLNTRLTRAGGRILLSPDIRATYFSRSTMASYVSRNVIDGLWALYPIRFGSRLMRWRHLAPLACGLAALVLLMAAPVVPQALPVLGGLVAAYLLLAVAASIHLARRERDARLLVLAPILFVLRHVPYGIGSLWGALRGVAGRLADGPTSRPVAGDHPRSA